MATASVLDQDTGLAPVHHAPRRRRDIQGLRALAVLLVVAFHADLPVPGGFTGVDVFFVISGFVITAMLLPEIESSGRVRMSTFYSRRIRRLLPALAVTVVATTVLSTVFLSPFGPQAETAKTGAAASVFSANFQLFRSSNGGYFDLPAETNALLHTWSLSVEEQFYLVFPALLVLVLGVSSRLRRPRIAAAALVGLACVASFTACVLITRLSETSGAGVGPIRALGGTPQAFAFYSPFTRAWEFGVGVLLAIAVPYLCRTRAWIGRVAGIAGVALIALAAFAFDETTSFPGAAAAVPVAGAGLLLYAGLQPGGVSWALSRGPLVRIGDLSYGWYLWHWPLIVFARALWPRSSFVLVVAALVALGPALASERWVENPIRHNATIRGRRLVSLTAICIIGPLVACAALWASSSFERRLDPVASMEDLSRPTTDGGNGGCWETIPISAKPNKCTWLPDDDEAAAGTVYVIGDSNAAHFVPAVNAAAQEHDYEVRGAFIGGCPPVDLVLIDGAWDGVSGETCHEIAMANVQTLMEEKPEMVFIAMASPKYVSADVRLADPATGEIADTDPERILAWERGLTSVLERFESAGIPTVVVHAVPYFGSPGNWWSGEGCPAVRIVFDSCGMVASHEEVEGFQAPAREAERRAIASSDTAVGLDVSADVCTISHCATKVDGEWIYRDGTHLSFAGALGLADRFTEVMASQAQ